MSNLSEIASVASAVAAALSAAAAWWVSSRTTKVDRERQKREVSLLANRIDAAAIGVSERGEELKVAYDTLFIKSGRVGGGLQDLYKNRVEERQKAVEPMQEAARCLLKDNLRKLRDEQLVEQLLKLDGHFIFVEQNRQAIDAELAFVNGQISAAD